MHYIGGHDLSSEYLLIKASHEYFYRTVLVKYLSSKADDSVSASSRSAGGGSDKVKGDTILLMLLRLRQCCSHPTLTKTVSDGLICVFGFSIGI